MPLAKQLTGYIADPHGTLQEVLTEESTEVLEKFNDCRAEHTAVNECEISIYFSAWSKNYV